MNIESLLKLPESKTLEFKENLSSAEKLLPTVIAFANTAGGKLVIGIENKSRHVVGIESVLKAEEKIANIISDSLEPKLVPNIEIIKWRNTNLIIVEIYPSPTRPHYIKSKGINASTYIRVGSTNRLADPELIEVIKRSVQIKTFDELPCYESNSEAINFRLASELFKPYRVLKESDLYSLGVLIKEGNKTIPTKGGVLLFGKDVNKYFSDAWIQAGYFEGKDKSNIMDHLEVRESLILAVEKGIEFVHKHSLTSVEIGNIRRKNITNIPKIAIREAIINAIVHCDYSLSGAPIRISIFEDRVEIENPGLLHIGMTIEDMISGISKIRNRVISRVFYELHLVEQWGSGIQRMLKSCSDAGLPEPKFEEISTRFRVTIYTTKIGPIVISDIETQIIKLLEQYNLLSTSELSKYLGISTRSVRYNLLRLLEKEKIIEIAKNPTDPKKKYIIKN